MSRTEYDYVMYTHMYLFYVKYAIMGCIPICTYIIYSVDKCRNISRTEYDCVMYTYMYVYYVMYAMM